MMVGELRKYSTALILVMTIVVGTMGLRSSTMVAAAIPTCFLFASIFLAAIDYSFNFMVCFGLLISLGMLIDGCVVVVEYADRKMAEGFDRIEVISFLQKNVLASDNFYWNDIIIFVPMFLCQEFLDNF